MFIVSINKSFISSEIVFLADWWSKSNLTLHISKKDYEQCGKEHGLLIMNHTYETDWLLGWMFTEKIGVLGVSILISQYLNYQIYSYQLILSLCIYIFHIRKWFIL